MAAKLSAVCVTEPDGDVRRTLETAARALSGGVSAILVRRPHATAREVFALVRQLRPSTRAAHCLLLVSDRADVAIAAGADGVHLGARSLPVASARRVVGNDVLVGRSVHNLDEAGQAEEEGANYLFLGPVFPTPSHPGEPALGLGPLREAALRARVPVVGIGGITSDNVRLVAQAGGNGAAAIGAFYSSDAAETARAFRAAFPA
ncbi:MAG TPA: thiamine phosphate synthase [Planctomycetota bacterium]|nr:thiamine phosphate synthase [Planctomycetota bacterium]